MSEDEEVSWNEAGRCWQHAVALEGVGESPAVLGEEVQDRGVRLGGVNEPACVHVCVCVCHSSEIALYS